jgi:ribose transport system substrate-binding protein
MKKTWTVATAVGGILALAQPPVASAKPLVFGISTIGMSYPFIASIDTGFRQAAGEAGVTVISLDARGDIQKQANDLQDLIQQHADGIAFTPLDAVVAQGWVDRISNAGIPAVAVSSQVGDPAKHPAEDVYPKLTALATQDEVAAGKSAGKLAATLLPAGKTAQIAVIEGRSGLAEVAQRLDGFKQGLDAAGAHYRIVASQPGDWTAEKAESACQNILQSNPDVDLFFNEADDMVLGCAKAVHSAGSNAKLLGMGGSKIAIALIKSGRIDGTVCYKPQALGKTAFKLLYEQVTGQQTRHASFVPYDTPAITKANVADCIPEW